ncbi:helix-turn-helix domain-containing protein [Phocaeicola paurosaccharolyticus]|uniref:helix-turn-helix domain-containing protein n=1 Tax=Phocaeicola paurosaccharolyticus TaxID=732242 RepID=UPI002FE329F7
MKYRIIILISLLLISVGTSAQKKNKELAYHLEVIKRHHDNSKSLNFLCRFYLNKGDFSKVVTYSEYMKNIGKKNNNQNLILFSSLYQGEAQMMSGREKVSKKNLLNAYDIAIYSKNDSALSIVYGALGQYSANIDTDYYRAIQWLFKGISLARKHNYQQQYALLLSKLASIYYLKRDIAGLKYAQESYDLGHEMNDPSIIYQGAINTAYMYFMLKQNDKATKYVMEAEKLIKENEFYDQANTYNLLGNLLSELKEYPQAMNYYKEAMNDKKSSPTASVVYAHIGYAKVLMAQNRYKEAIKILKQGLAISFARTNAVHRSAIYETISQCYEKLNQFDNALQYYKVFRYENDSVFNKDKERDLSELRFKYDTERQENQIKQGRIEVVQKEKRIQQQTFILIIIVIVLLLLYYLYRRKNRLYISIVKQNQEAIKRENDMQRHIEDLEQRCKAEVNSEKYAASSLSEEKSDELFRVLERTMREKKIYKDNMLTKEKVADLLGTNRTYLSRIINEQSNLSFTHYINSFRIEEAVRLLSDPDNDTPLKAISAELGFNSISTFYSLFQSSIGMTPSQYRRKVIEIKEKK